MTDPDESGDRGILDPEELELDDDRVTELDDNRYLIDTGGGPSVPDDPGSELAGSDGNDPAARRTDGSGGRPPAGSDPSEKLDAELDGLRATRTDRPSESRSGSGRPNRERTGEATGIADVPEQYGVQLTAKTDHGVDTVRVTSNDVREVFEETLRWYAERVDPSTPPEEVIRVLLSASAFDVR